jgi:hypothetical protein
VAVFHPWTLDKGLNIQHKLPYKSSFAALQQKRLCNAQFSVSGCGAGPRSPQNIAKCILSALAFWLEHGHERVKQDDCRIDAIGAGTEIGSKPE